MFIVPIIGVLALIVAVIAFTVMVTTQKQMRTAKVEKGKLYGYNSHERNLIDRRDNSFMTATIALVAGVILGLVAMVTIVPTNHVGVEVLFGKPTERTFDEGLNFKNPFASVHDIIGLQQESTYSNEVQEGEKERPDAIRARTADNAEVDVDATVLWFLNLEGTAPIEIYREYKYLDQIQNRLLRPVSRDVLRDCIAAVPFEEAGTSERAAIALCARDGIATSVSPFIIVRDVQIREVDLLSDQIRAGIERKLAAEQAAQEAEFRRQQAEIDAETARIAAEGVANAEIERARGTKRANELISESLTDQLVEYYSWKFASESDGTIYFMEADTSVQPVIPVPIP